MSETLEMPEMVKTSTPVSGKVQISRAELTRLRNEENLTITEVARHFGVSNQQIKRAMEQCGLTTSLSGRKRMTYTLVD